MILLGGAFDALRCYVRDADMGADVAHRPTLVRARSWRGWCVGRRGDREYE